jgi:predicted DNA-binding transcriptional regulator AlpA
MLTTPPLEHLDAAGLTALLGEVTNLQFRILGRLNPPPAAATPAEPSRLVNIAEAAGLLGMSEGWLYRNASTMPFATRPNGRSWRFDTRGIAKYLRDRQPC